MDAVKIRLRPAESTDLPFQQALYGSTRAAELSQTGWSPEQVQAFIESQFQAQTLHYARFFPQAETSIVLFEDPVQHGGPIGRMIVDRSGSAILLMDIALLPEVCNRGIGTGLIRALMAEAEQAGQPLRLHVETFNPAQRLYARLGFKAIAEEGIYRELEWRPTLPEHPALPEQQVLAETPEQPGGPTR